MIFFSFRIIFVVVFEKRPIEAVHCLFLFSQRNPIILRLQNIEPTKMIIGKAATKPVTLMEAKEKRRAFGDIENRIG